MLLLQFLKKYLMKNKLLSIKFVLIITLLILLNIVFLFYLKYTSHHLSASEFSIKNIGNMINLILTLGSIVGLFGLMLKKASTNSTFLWILIGLMYLFLFSILIINSMDIPSREYYLYSLSFTQVLIISAFGLFQFTQVFLMIMIWQNIFKIEKLIYLRAFVNTIFVLAGIFVFTIIFINTNLSYTKASEIKNSKNNVAVVLGAAVWSNNKPSPSLASRVDKAAELYNQGIVQKIQLTGGNAPGELSEAEVSLNYILKKNVKRKDILIEKSTTSTIEQVRFIKYKLLSEKQMNDVIIVSDIYHIHRVKEICKFYNLKAKVTSSKLNFKTDKIVFYQLKECMALLLFWLFAL